MSSTASSTESVARHPALLIGAWLVAFGAFYMAVRTPVAIGNFLEVFSSLDAEVKPLTRLVIELRHVWWLFGAAAFGVAVWVSWRSRVSRSTHRRMVAAVIVVIGVMLVAFLCAMWALYQPILALDAAV